MKGDLFMQKLQKNKHRKNPEKGKRKISTAKKIMAAILSSLMIAGSILPAFAADMDTNGQGQTGNTESVDKKKFSWPSPFNWGLRFTLIDVNTKSEVMVEDILKTDTNISTQKLGSHSKAFTNGANPQGSAFGSYNKFNFEMPPTPGAGNGEHWFKDNATTHEVIPQVFGITYEDLTSGKYHVFVEPMFEVLIDYKPVLGTATELAYYCGSGQYSLAPGSELILGLGNILNHIGPKYLYLEKNYNGVVSLKAPQSSGGSIGCTRIKNEGWGVGILTCEKKQSADYKIAIKKVDSENGKILKDAKFRFKATRPAGNGKTKTIIDATPSTGDDGYITLNTKKVLIKPGDKFVIEEIKAPEGYEKIPGQSKIEFTISPDKKEYVYTVKNKPLISEVIPSQPDITGDHIIKSDELSRCFCEDVDMTGNNINDSAPGYRVHEYRWEWQPVYGRNERGNYVVVDYEEVEVHDRQNCSYWSSSWQKKATIPECLYHSNHIFKNDDLMNHYKTMHGSSTLLHQFPGKSGDIFRSDYNWNRDVFEELTRMCWVSHRTGINSSPTQEIPMAEYMKDSPQNKEYDRFIKEINPSGPKKKYEEDYNSNYGLTKPLLALFY